MRYFEKIAYPPKSDLARIMAHYNVSEEQAIKMLKEKSVEELLPARGRANRVLRW